MGVVLKAVDKSLDRTVAIKVLAPHLATSGAARKRFGSRSQSRGGGVASQRDCDSQRFE